MLIKHVQMKRTKKSTNQQLNTNYKEDEITVGRPLRGPELFKKAIEATQHYKFLNFLRVNNKK